MIYGFPLVALLGIATLASIFTTALLGYLYHNQLAQVPLKWHIRMATLSLILASIHALVGILGYV